MVAPLLVVERAAAWSPVCLRAQDLLRAAAQMEERAALEVPLAVPPPVLPLVPQEAARRELLRAVHVPPRSRRE